MNDSVEKEEVLSAEEIEALVERAQEPGFDDGEFRAHDFSVGQSLSMASWTELTTLLDNHAEALSGVLSSEYGFNILVTSEPKAFCSASDLLAMFPERLCLISTPTEPFGSEIHAVLPGGLLTTLVNHYFGGGSLPSPAMKSRVTPSEQRIGERVAKNFFRSMTEIWSDRMPLSFGDLYVDVTPDRFAMIPKATGFAVFPFAVDLGNEDKHTLNLLIPFDNLETHEDCFKPATKPLAREDKASDWEPEMKAILPTVPVEVRGELCDIKATLRALLKMQVGTTIPISEPAEVKIVLDSDAIARGRYGAFDGFKAMQFIRFEEEEV